MADYDGARVKVQVLLQGYQQALARFSDATTGRDAAPAFFALFECLNWAHAVDDLIGEVWRPAGSREGFEWRGRIPGGEVMDGVRYGRNRVHHQWADALVVIEEGFRFPLKFPMEFHFRWVWRPVAELPTPDEKRPDPGGRAAYAEVLDGESAEGTLLALAEVFSRVEAFLVPPELERLSID